MRGLRELGRSAINAALERVGRGFSQVQERKPLLYDLLEDDDHYLVVFDAPGASKEDVQVRFMDGELEVRIDRYRDFYEGFEMRFPGRGLTLRGHADLPPDASVHAGVTGATVTKSGTLRVTLPKDGSAQNVAVEEEAARNGRARSSNGTF